MIENINKELDVDYEIDLLYERLCEELEERIEMACWVNMCGCKGVYVVPAA
ncbi:MAG TPA: hypothetical protein VJ888_03745 [Mobilitalea sp.]|nr:hypothetical protein [Mobilitalea sp.]